MLFVRVGWHGGFLLPTSCLFREFQAASKDPRHNYRRYALFRTEGVFAYAHLCLRATVAVNLIGSSKQRYGL